MLLLGSSEIRSLTDGKVEGTLELEEKALTKAFAERCRGGHVDGVERDSRFLLGPSSGRVKHRQDMEKNGTENGANWGWGIWT